MAQVISSLTVSLRRASDFNIDINEYQTNLVPFQKRHFMLTSFAPLKSIEAPPGPLSVEQMVHEAFETENLLANCNPAANDKIMACCLIFRGNVSTIDANAALDTIKRRQTINLVDWCPTGFKIGINANAPGYVKDGQLAHMDR